MLKYPYGKQSVDENDIRAVVKALKSDWLTQGPMVERFEKSLGRVTGAKYNVVVTNGTAALHLACLAAGLSEGQEMITTPMTFAASANCGRYCGAEVRFADIDTETGLIQPEAVAKAVTRKTRVVIPVHYAGFPVNMKALREGLPSRNITVIEDACHALGAVETIRGKKIPVGSCSYSDMTIFSFHPVKTIATGEGGAVCTNRKDLYEALLRLRNHGVVRSGFRHETASDGDWYYEMRDLGLNARMTDLQAALGVSQLKKLPAFLRRRRDIGAIYNGVFAGNPWFDMPEDWNASEGGRHLFVIRLKDSLVRYRKDIFQEMRKAGVGVQVHYIPVYRHPYYRKLGYRRSDYPNTEDFYKRIFSLPLYPALTDGDLDTIITRVERVFKKFVR